VATQDDNQPDDQPDNKNKNPKNLMPSAQKTLFPVQKMRLKKRQMML
jgi:hypothetical protein